MEFTQLYILDEDTALPTDVGKSYHDWQPDISTAILDNRSESTLYD